MRLGSRQPAADHLDHLRDAGSPSSSSSICSTDASTPRSATTPPTRRSRSRSIRRRRYDVRRGLRPAQARSQRHRARLPTGDAPFPNRWSPCRSSREGGERRSQRAPIESTSSGPPARARTARRSRRRTSRSIPPSTGLRSGWPAGRCPRRSSNRQSQRDASILVVGSGGDAEPGRIRLTSKTDRLVHSSTVPVAIAPRGYRTSSGVTRITVAFRDDDASWSLLTRVAEISQRASAQLRVVTFLVSPSQRPVTSDVSHAETQVIDLWAVQAAAAQAEAAGPPELDGLHRRRRSAAHRGGSGLEHGRSTRSTGPTATCWCWGRRRRTGWRRSSSARARRRSSATRRCRS